MAFSLDSDILLYAFGIVFAVAALLFFASDVAFGLSLTVTAALLLFSFLAFLVAGLAIDRERIDAVAFAISGLSYGVFLLYVLEEYDLGDGLVFLLLALSAGLFVGFGYVIQEDLLAVDRRRAGAVVIVLAIAGVLLVGADTAGSVEYAFDVDDEIVLDVEAERTADDVAGAEEDHVYAEQTIGTLTVRNPTPFTRPVDAPSLSACFVGGERADVVDGVQVRYDPSRYGVADTIARNDELTVEIRAQFHLPADEISDGDRIAIERDDGCDASRSDPTVIVFTEE